MSAIQDRTYQREFLDGNDRFPGVIGAWEAGTASVLGMLPTGCGKTICAGMVAARALADHGRRTLFLAHREELIRQAQDKLSRMGLECGVEMADERAASMTLFGGVPDVTIATVQTLQKARLAAQPPTRYGVIITDEAHHARARSYRRIYDHFRGYWHLGITATPDRGDRLNIGSVYESLAYEYTLRQAIADGWLCPIVTARMPCSVSLKDIRTTGGDFNQAELEAAVSPHIEALCRIVAGEIGDRPTVVFTPDVGSAEMAADCLAQLGITARPVSGRTGRGDRRAALEGFDRRDFRVLTCCDLLIEGWDCPKVACVVVMRPTKVRSRYVQMIGRGTRPFGTPGQKPNCLVIDFAWETTGGHDLVTPIDLFDDSALDDEVAEVARELVRSGQEKDPSRAIDEAEEIIRRRRTFQVRLTGNQVAYRKVVFDPIGVGHLCGIPIKQGWDFNPHNPATPRQLARLQKAGIEGTDGLSQTGAGKLISEIDRRFDSGLATLKQVRLLVSKGVDPAQAQSMTFAQAGEALDQLCNTRRAG